jgi:hypothetical protein
MTQIEGPSVGAFQTKFGLADGFPARSSSKITDRQKVNLDWQYPRRSVSFRSNLDTLYYIRRNNLAGGEKKRYRNNNKEGGDAGHFSGQRFEEKKKPSLPQ